MSCSSSGAGRPQGSDALWIAIRKDRMLSLSITEPDVATRPTLRANLDDAVGKTYEKYCQLVGERLDAIPITNQGRFSVVVEQLEHFSPTHSLDAKGIPELERPFEEIQELADFPEMYVDMRPTALTDLGGPFKTFVADRIHEHGRHLNEASRDPVLRDKLLAEGIDKIKTLEKRAGLASEEAMRQAQEQARMRAEQAQRQRAAGGAIPVAEVPHGIGGPPEMAADFGASGLELQNAGRLQFLPPGLVWDPEFVMAVVRQNGLALESAAPEFQDDLDIVQAAIGNNADAIMFASPRLQAQLRS